MAEPISAAVAAVVTYVSGSFAAVSAGTATLAQTAVVVGTQFAVSAGVSFLLSPQVGAGGSPTDWTVDPDAGIPFVCGRRGVAGQLVHRDEWGPDNRYQSFVTIYSGAGPIDGFEDFHANDILQTFGANERPTSGDWSDVMWMQRRIGEVPDTALTQPSDPTVSGTLPAWGASHRLSGKACSMWTLAQNKARDRYPSGPPKPMQVVRGIKVYDPRYDSTYPGGAGGCRIGNASTYVYSTNPIIHALNFCIGYRENGKVVGGIGDGDTPSLDGIDTDAFIACANVADANSWTLSAGFTTKDRKHQVLIGMLQAGGAVYAPRAGRMSCYARGGVKPSIATITARDTAGPIRYTTVAARDERINTVIPKVVQEQHGWKMVDLPAVSEAAYVAEDETELGEGVDYPFVSDANQGAQLAAYDIVDSRENIAGEVPVKPYMRHLKPGDAFTVNEPGFVLNGQKFLVVRRSFNPMTGGATISFRSETDEKHAYALGQTTTPPPASVIIPASPTDLAAPDPADWDLTASTIDGAGGETRPAIVIAGGVTNAQADQFEIQYRYRLPDGQGGWQSWGPWLTTGPYHASIDRVAIDAVPAGAQVEARITYLSGTVRSNAPTSLGVVEVSDQQVVTSVGGLTRFDIEDDLAAREIAAEEAAQALLQRELQFRDRADRDRQGVYNRFETERTERIESDLAEATLRETQISAVEGNIALIETEAETLATSLAAETSIRETQISAVEASLAVVEGETSTLATALTAETSARTLQISSVEASVAALESETTTLASDLAAEVTARTNAIAAHDSQLATLTTNYNLVATDVAANGSALSTLQADFTTQDATLSAVVSDLATVEASVASLEAVRLIQAATTATYAGVLIRAFEAGGAQASDIRFAAGKIGFGATYTGPRFVFDMDAAQVYAWNDDFTVKTFLLWLSDGRLQLRTSSGDLAFDTTGGGTYSEGIVDAALGGRAGGFLSQHDLTYSADASAVADFIAVSLPTDPIPMAPAERIQVRFDYDIQAVKDAFQWYKFRDRVRIEARLNGGAWATVITRSWKNRRFTTTVNTGGVGSQYGSAEPVVDSHQSGFVIAMPAGSYNEVRAVLDVEPYGAGYSTAIEAPDNSKVQNYLKLVDLQISIDHLKTGPFAGS